MILKNYKELCNVLEEEDKPQGTSRQNHIKWFEEYFSYKKEGHKFIITNILNKNVEPMVDKRGGSFNEVEYIENMQRLILDILAQNKNDGKIFLSKNKLFHMLEMVNINYLDCNRRLPKVSKYLDINEESVQEWYDTTGGMLERNVNSALKKLASQSLIFWSREITVCQVVSIFGSGGEYLYRVVNRNEFNEETEDWKKGVATKNVIREATDEEKKFILKTERITMLQLDCDDKQEIIRKGLWKEFEDKVKKIVQDKYNIAYYYQSYKILFNPEHILKKQNQLNDLLMNQTDRVEQKSIVNKSIMKRIESNAVSRKTKAIEEYEKIEGYNSRKDERLLRRSTDTYIEDNIKLNETLIDKNAKDVRFKIKKVELD